MYSFTELTLRFQKPQHFNLAFPCHPLKRIKRQDNAVDLFKTTAMLLLKFCDAPPCFFNLDGDIGNLSANCCFKEWNRLQAILNLQCDRRHGFFPSHDMVPSTSPCLSRLSIVI
jgi:hypothetical protein